MGAQIVCGICSPDFSTMGHAQHGNRELDSDEHIHSEFTKIASSTPLRTDCSVHIYRGTYDRSFGCVSVPQHLLRTAVPQLPKPSKASSSFPLRSLPVSATSINPELMLDNSIDFFFLLGSALRASSICFVARLPVWKALLTCRSPARSCAMWH